jgi:hypothetical protein
MRRKQLLKYAANRNGEKNVIRTARKYYKNELHRAKKSAKRATYSDLVSIAKEQGKSNNQIKKMGRKGLEKFAMRNNNIVINNDLKVRAKALKDEELRNSKVYK